MGKLAYMAVLSLILIAGCGESDKPRFSEEQLKTIPMAQRTDLPVNSGDVVLSVSKQTITTKEIVEPLMDGLRPTAQTSDTFDKFEAAARPEVEQLLMAKISNVLLYENAKKEYGGDSRDFDDRVEKAVDGEIRRFIDGFNGDYAKAEAELRRMGMDWRTYREYQERMILVQSFVASKFPENKPITRNELEGNYERMKEKSFTMTGSLKFRLIDIEPDKVSPDDPNGSRLDAARRLAAAIVKRLEDGEDFGELAKQYSDGHKKDAGGLWNAVNPDSLAEPYDVLAKEAEKIEPNQIAGPIEVTGHIFIMKLEEKQQYQVKSLDEVQKEVETQIHFDRRKKVIDELLTKLAGQMTIEGKDMFVDHCVKEIWKRGK